MPLNLLRRYKRKFPIFHSRERWFRKRHILPLYEIISKNKVHVHFQWNTLLTFIMLYNVNIGRLFLMHGDWILSWIDCCWNSHNAVNASYLEANKLLTYKVVLKFLADSAQKYHFVPRSFFIIAPWSFHRQKTSFSDLFCYTNFVRRTAVILGHIWYALCYKIHTLV